MAGNKLVFSAFLYNGVDPVAKARDLSLRTTAAAAAGRTTMHKAIFIPLALLGMIAGPALTGMAGAQEQRSEMFLMGHFSVIDRDDDGVLDRTELGAFGEHAFDLIDRDGDGTLTFMEFVEMDPERFLVPAPWYDDTVLDAQQELPGPGGVLGRPGTVVTPPEPPMRTLPPGAAVVPPEPVRRWHAELPALFDIIDQDDDGTISVAEFSDHHAAVLDVFDDDGDGVIDREEFERRLSGWE
jgi:Ca2+-binding EF-hand superfamily protein